MKPKNVEQQAKCEQAEDEEQGYDWQLVGTDSIFATTKAIVDHPEMFGLTKLPPAKESLDGGVDMLTGIRNNLYNRSKVIDFFGCRIIPEQDFTEIALAIQRFCSKFSQPKANTELVAINEESFRPYLISAMSDFATAQKTREFGADKSDIMLNHLHIICSTFGQSTPSAPLPCVEGVTGSSEMASPVNLQSTPSKPCPYTHEGDYCNKCGWHKLDTPSKEYKVGDLVNIPLKSYTKGHVQPTCTCLDCRLRTEYNQAVLDIIQLKINVPRGEE